MLADAYRIARDKLRLIADQLDPERFELLFSRVMSLVPPEELAAVFGAAKSLSSGDETEHRIATIVRLGYDKLSRFSDQYSEGARRLRDLDAGDADWTDLREFLKRVCAAETDAPGTKPVFSLENAEIVSTEAQVHTLRVFNKQFVCDETDGLPCHDADGLPLPRLGMDSKLLMTRLRERIEDAKESGVGAVKVNARLLHELGDAAAFIVFLGMQRLTFAGGVTEERSLDLVGYTVDRNGRYAIIERSKLAFVVRTVYGAERQTRPSSLQGPVLHGLDTALPLLVNDAREAAARQEASPVAVWPVACFILAPS